MSEYDFTVIMAVYNTEPFLKEAIDSLIGQTLGFSHIQLILVDDGSIDGSGRICDEYQNRHPENIVVVHKENGGVSSARNMGILLAKGKYLNYMDSDDRMESDAFEKVLAFFEKHEDETDVVAIPVRFFDGQSGEHIQNHKFSLKEDVVNLFEHPFITNLSCSYSFFKTESATDFTFDTQLAVTEDSKYALSVLLKKMTLGLVRDTVYWYRKRSNGEPSALQSQTTKSSSYIPWLEHYANWALDYAEQQMGNVPKFVQYEVMYDLQWKLRQTHIPFVALSPNERARYREMLKDTLGRIDADVIMAQRNISEPYKVFAIMQKRGKGLSIRKTQGDIELLFDQNVIASVSRMETVWDFLTFNKSDNTYTIEGHHLLYGIENETAEPYMIVNDRPVPCDSVKRINDTYVFCGEEIVKLLGFRASVSAAEAKVDNIRSAVKLQGTLVERQSCDYGFFFPISNVYKSGYAHLGRHTATVGKNGIVLSKRRGPFNDIVREINYLLEVWKKNRGNARKGVLFRLIGQMARLFKFRKLWIVSDRSNRADDNGEAFFEFLLAHKPPRTKVVFAVGKEAKDYQRLSKMGRCVPFSSFGFKVLFLLCDVNISSHADQRKYCSHHEELRDLQSYTKHVFLQHGVIKDDMSEYLNRYKQNISGFVTSAVPEYDSINNGSYGYRPGEVWLTGLPRFDRLYRAEGKRITIMPTWRMYLMERIYEGANEWAPKDNFEKKEFYQFYNALINSGRLIGALQENGYVLQFFPHPLMNPYIDRFHHDSRVVFLSTSETNYRDVYAMSELVVTDYSSSAFDFAYLRKPLVYCQFDKEEFFSGEQLYVKGYFDYERDGFGEVVYDLDHAIDLIIEYVKGGCVLKDKYRERIDAFFAFNDQNNCQRVLDKILSM